MIKLYFTVYKDEKKELQHTILYRDTKKELTAELKSQVFSPCGIFGINDVESIEHDLFTDIPVTDAVISYVKEHLEEWKKQL